MHIAITNLHILTRAGATLRVVGGEESGRRTDYLLPPYKGNSSAVSASPPALTGSKPPARSPASKLNLSPWQRLCLQKSGRKPVLSEAPQAKGFSCLLFRFKKITPFLCNTFSFAPYTVDVRRKGGKHYGMQ